MTQRSFASPFERSVHVTPPSRVPQTLPSSVPAQMTPKAFGDSAIEVIVPKGTSPCSRSEVRSPEIAAQVSPRSNERYSLLVP